MAGMKDRQAEKKQPKVQSPLTASARVLAAIERLINTEALADSGLVSPQEIAESAEVRDDPALSPAQVRGALGVLMRGGDLEAYSDGGHAGPWRYRPSHWIRWQNRTWAKHVPEELKAKASAEPKEQQEQEAVPRQTATRDASASRPPWNGPLGEKYRDAVEADVKVALLILKFFDSLPGAGTASVDAIGGDWHLHPPAGMTVTRESIERVCELLADAHLLGRPTPGIGVYTRTWPALAAVPEGVLTQGRHATARVQHETKNIAELLAANDRVHQAFEKELRARHDAERENARYDEEVRTLQKLLDAERAASAALVNRVSALLLIVSSLFPELRPELRRETHD
jgi:hypothetical protein